jgi:hypothetical protein
MTVQDMLTIDVKPGWKSGTKVTFQGKGNEAPGQPAGNVQFVVREAPHPRFVRDGNDLVYTAKLSLKDALLGGNLRVQHLSGETVPATFEGPVCPSRVIIVKCVPLGLLCPAVCGWHRQACLLCHASLSSAVVCILWFASIEDLGCSDRRGYECAGERACLSQRVLARMVTCASSSKLCFLRNSATNRKQR